MLLNARELTFELIEKYVDDIVTVSDEEIASTILLLLERAKLVAEGSGAASLAAVLYRQDLLKNKKVAVVISGGNIDVNFTSRIIEKGLVKTEKCGIENYHLTGREPCSNC